MSSTDWDDLEELFARIDAEPKNTILVFDDVEIANKYSWHTAAYRRLTGALVRVEDTRTKSGLLTQWRDPIPSDQIVRRQREALWLLEEVIAGRVPRPERGKVSNISAEVEIARQAAGPVAGGQPKGQQG